MIAFLPLICGMEATKRYSIGMGTTCPSVGTQNSSVPMYSYIWEELKNRLPFGMHLEKRRTFGFMGATSTSLLPQRKFFDVPKDSNVYSWQSNMQPSWSCNTNFDCLKQRALPDYRVTAEKCKFDLFNASVLRQITQNLLNFFQLQHMCDLLIEISRSHEEMCTMENEYDVNVHKTDNNTNSREVFGIRTKNSDSEGFCEKIITPETQYCDSYISVITVVNSPSYSCSSSARIMSEMETKLSNVDEKMVSRKQRQLNRHSKKRKRRMKKKNQVSLHKISYKEDRGVKKNITPGESSQVKIGSCQLPSAEERRKAEVFDSDESDEDLCIVFEAEVNCGGESVHFLDSSSSYPDETAGISDLWIEFDSFAIVPGSDRPGRDANCRSSQIFIQCDSDSECEAETGEQIFVNVSEFDSWSGLLFPSNDSFGHSELQNDVVDGPSFASTISFCETPAENEIETCEIHRINQRWKEMTSDVKAEPRLPQRVTFACEEDLVAVFPVDVMDRKSQWEQFALERFRFKRRIDEFEKIITPYLTAAHREKIFKGIGNATS